MVEFGLTLPIFILLVIGALDFGMAFYTKVVLTNAAREGANYMVYYPEDSEGASERAVDELRIESGGSSFIDPAEVTVEVQCLVAGVATNPPCPHRSTVAVTVGYEMPLLADVIFQGPLQLQSEARMLIP